MRVDLRSVLLCDRIIGSEKHIPLHMEEREHLKEVFVQTLETEHLKLIPFSLELKKATISERARMASILGIQVPDSWPGPDLAEMLPSFVEMMEKDPTSRVWDGIIIHKEDQVAIGGIGFHGEPDEAGVVEIGYNIIPEYQPRLNLCNDTRL